MADGQGGGGRGSYRELMRYGVSALIGSLVVIAIGRTTIGVVLVGACLAYLAWVWTTKRPRGDGG
jgi:hypothetical protein